MRPRTENLKLPVLALVACLTLAAAASGIQPPQETAKAGAAFSSPALTVAPSLEVVGSTKAFANSELQAFFAKHSDEWKVVIDQRNNLPHLIQGKGVPLLPGNGNSLSRQNLKLAQELAVLKQVVEELSSSLQDGSSKR